MKSPNTGMRRASVRDRKSYHVLLWVSTLLFQAFRSALCFSYPPILQCNGSTRCLQCLKQVASHLERGGRCSTSFARSRWLSLCRTKRGCLKLISPFGRRLALPCQITVMCQPLKLSIQIMYLQTSLTIGFVTLACTLCLYNRFL